MQVVVTGSFDNLRSPHVRFLHEASRLGDVHLLLWPDEAVRALEGREPKFPQEERLYFLEAVRYVTSVRLIAGPIESDAACRAAFLERPALVPFEPADTE